MTYAFPVVPRYAEVDQQGVVFNGHYLTWFDEAFTGFLDHVGLPYPKSDRVGRRRDGRALELDYGGSWCAGGPTPASRYRASAGDDELHPGVRRVVGGRGGGDGRNVYVVVVQDPETGAWCKALGIPEELAAAPPRAREAAGPPFRGHGSECPSDPRRRRRAGCCRARGAGTRGRGRGSRRGTTGRRPPRRRRAGGRRGRRRRGRRGRRDGGAAGVGRGGRCRRIASPTGDHPDAHQPDQVAGGDDEQRRHRQPRPAAIAPSPAIATRARTTVTGTDSQPRNAISHPGRNPGGGSPTAANATRTPGAADQPQQPDDRPDHAQRDAHAPIMACAPEVRVRTPPGRRGPRTAGSRRGAGRRRRSRSAPGSAPGVRSRARPGRPPGRCGR